MSHILGVKTLLVFAFLASAILLCGAKSSPAQPPAVSKASEGPQDTLLGDIFDQGRPGVDVQQIRQKWLDIPYATRSPAETLDIYLPESGTSPYPVIVAIHGGSFYRGDKRDFQIVPMLRALKRGYALVSINYRLSGEARFPSQIYDVNAAIRWVRAQAGHYALDPERIALWGDSAGGNLAALAGVSAQVAAFSDQTLGNAETSNRVSAVVDWYGPINLLTVAAQLNKKNIPKDGSPATRLFGKSKEEAPELYQAESPENYITPECPPFFIQHGDTDTLVSVQQSMDFAAKLQDVLGRDKVTLEILPGAGHLDAAFNTDQNIDRVLDFLDKYMK